MWRGMEKLMFGALARVVSQDGFRARGGFDFSKQMESREEHHEHPRKLHTGGKRWVNPANMDRHIWYTCV